MESSPEALPVIEELPCNIEQNWSVSDDVVTKRIDADDFDVYSIQPRLGVLSSFDFSAKKSDFSRLNRQSLCKGAKLH